MKRIAFVGAMLALSCAGAAHAAGYTTLTGPDGQTTISPTYPLAVSTVGASGATSTDASGTVTLGGTYQTLLASSTTRKGCLIQNPTTATEALNVRVGAGTVFNLLAGGTFSCAAPGGLVVTDTISVTAATNGHAFSANSQ